MRLALSLAFAALALPAFAGEPYTPLPLKPAELVTPSEELLASARTFLVSDGRGGEAMYWGTAPLVKNGVCTSAYRSFDLKAIATLGKLIDVETSSFFYVDAATPLYAGMDDKGPVAMTLEPDRLYGLDYDTSAPGRWIAVHMPQGGSGFINFDKVELQKPYAAGICFTEGKDGQWLMSAQVSTSL